MQCTCREDEGSLVKAMQSGQVLQKQIAVLEAAYQRPPSSAELERELKLNSCQVRAKLKQGLRALQTLVHANKKLVFKLAHRFGWEQNLPFEDCVMVGFPEFPSSCIAFRLLLGLKLDEQMTSANKSLAVLICC